MDHLLSKDFLGNTRLAFRVYRSGLFVRRLRLDLRPRRHRPPWAEQLTPAPHGGSPSNNDHGSRHVTSTGVILMAWLTFKWHDGKAKARKHRIRFEEVLAVFDDKMARSHPDISHSLDKSREIILGHSLTDRLLVVSSPERRRNIICLVSARKATRTERKD